MSNDNSPQQNNEQNPYLTNPLHGTSLATVVEQLVDHYGWEILAAYINIKCFNVKPSLASSIKFLKKTDWAREKVENFYLYQFKSLPKASESQFAKPPRERIIPAQHKPGAPKELSLEDAERLREKRAKKSREHAGVKSNNPWGNF